MDSNNDRFILKHGTDNELSEKLSEEFNLTDEDAELFASFLSNSDLCSDNRKILGISANRRQSEIIIEPDDTLNVADTPHSILKNVSKYIFIILVIVAVITGKLSALFGIGLIFFTLILNGHPSKPKKVKYVSVGPLSINVSKTTLALFACLVGFTPLGNLSQIGECLKDIGDSINMLTNEEKVVLSFLKEAHKDTQEDIRISELEYYTKAKHPLIKSVEELNGILDSLAEKDLIKIRMERIIV